MRFRCPIVTNFAAELSKSILYEKDLSSLSLSLFRWFWHLASALTQRKQALSSTRPTSQMKTLNKIQPKEATVSRQPGYIALLTRQQVWQYPIIPMKPFYRTAYFMPIPKSVSGFSFQKMPSSTPCFHWRVNSVLYSPARIMYCPVLSKSMSNIVCLY